MPKLLLFGVVGFMVWCFMTLSTIQTSTARISFDAQRVDATKAALTGTTCLSCHNPDSGNMLPIRKTMNAETFTKWVRGSRSFHGYTACPIPPVSEFSDADISRAYKILYGK